MANKAVSPSVKTISIGQIAKANEVLAAALRKSGLPFNETQQVLETHGDELAANYVADLRRRVDAISNMIVRRVTVDRTKEPQQVLDATNRRQYTDKSVVKIMPKGSGDEKEVYFFKLGRYVSDDDLAKEYELRGLVPDQYAQAQVNADDPSFADEHPNGSHWKDADGKWCFLAFDRWYDDGRHVNVYRYDRGWYDYWWFAGVRK